MGNLKASVMKSKLFTKTILLGLLFCLSFVKVSGQNSMPEVMENGSLKDQMNYVNEKTRIYENYRAIREDIFQKMKTNSLDSLNASKKEIIELHNNQSELETNIVELNGEINTLNENLEEAVINRDSLTLFGVRMNKAAYNKLLWTIIIALVALTIIVFLMFRRGHAVTKIAKTDLEDIKSEFETFRKVAHENKEKLIVGHFNEIKKLRDARM